MGAFSDTLKTFGRTHAFTLLVFGAGVALGVIGCLALAV